MQQQLFSLDLFLARSIALLLLYVIDDANDSVRMRRPPVDDGVHADGDAVARQNLERCVQNQCGGREREEKKKTCVITVSWLISCLMQFLVSLCAGTFSEYGALFLCLL